jgi:hypothetical protein
MTKDLISPDEFGVRTATADEILGINAFAEGIHWGARVSQAALQEGLSAEHKHLLLPHLRNGKWRRGEPDSVRCYAWLLRTSSDLRTLTYLDVAVDTILALPRLGKAQLERLAFHLVEMNRLVEIDEWPFVPAANSSADDD